LHCTSCMQIIYLHEISCKHQNALKTENLYDSYSKEIIKKNSKYEVHQVGQNTTKFQLTSFWGGGCRCDKNLRTTARDRRKIFFDQNMFLHSKKQIVNFGTRNSYSPRFQKSTKNKIKLILVFNFNINMKPSSRDC
jgi:hypothetical protein